MDKDILEERCNLQERIILDMYNDLESFEKMSETQYFEQMQEKIRYARRKAKKMRKELRRYIQG